MERERRKGLIGKKETDAIRLQNGIRLGSESSRATFQK